MSHHSRTHLALWATLLGLACASLLWVAGSAHAYIFWSNETSPFSLGRDTNDGNPANINPAFVANTGIGKGVAIDGNYIYWTNSSGNAIGRASLDGSTVNPTFIQNLPPPSPPTLVLSPKGVAVDGQHIYWTNATSPTTAFGSIGEANINGSNPQIIVQNASDPDGIAVDSNFLYWTNNQPSAMDPAGIAQANLDGSNANQTWITTSSPGAITVFGNTIYWTQFMQPPMGAILSADATTGTNIQPLVKGAGFPIGIATDGTYLYWTNRASNLTACDPLNPPNCSIGRANLDGSNVNEQFIANGYTNVLYGLALGLPPANISPPSIGGSPIGGDNLTATNGVWSSTPPSPTSYSYQWLRCNGTGGNCSPVPNATGQTYSLGPADVGSTMAVQQVAANLDGGPSVPVASAATGVISAPPAPSNSAAPMIQGSAVQGQTLTEIHGSWTGFPASFAVQWLRCNPAGAGCSSVAFGQTYTATNADVGSVLRAQEVVTDQYGDISAAASSTPTGVIQPGSPSVRTITAAGASATATISCVLPAGQSCTGSLTATADEYVSGQRVMAVAAKPRTQHLRLVTVTVAQVDFNIAAGSTMKVPLPLNVIGSHLLSEFYTLPVTLSFSDAATGPKAVTFRYPVVFLPAAAWHLSWSFTARPCSPCTTAVRYLVVRGLLPDAVVVVRCDGSGCPATRTFRPRTRSLNVASALDGRQLGVGATLTITGSAPGSVSRSVRYTVRAGRVPKLTMRCLAPGDRVATKCADS